jgi:hypothetical protein
MGHGVLLSGKEVGDISHLAGLAVPPRMCKDRSRGTYRPRVARVAPLPSGGIRDLFPGRLCVRSGATLESVTALLLPGVQPSEQAVSALRPVRQQNPSRWELSMQHVGRLDLASFSVARLVSATIAAKRGLNFIP